VFDTHAVEPAAIDEEEPQLFDCSAGHASVMGSILTTVETKAASVSLTEHTLKIAARMLGDF